MYLASVNTNRISNSDGGGQINLGYVPECQYDPNQCPRLQNNYGCDCNFFEDTMVIQITQCTMITYWKKLDLTE